MWDTEYVWNKSSIHRLECENISDLHNVLGANGHSISSLCCFISSLSLPARLCCPQSHIPCQSSCILPLYCILCFKTGFRQSQRMWLVPVWFSGVFTETKLMLMSPVITPMIQGHGQGKIHLAPGPLVSANSATDRWLKQRVWWQQLSITQVIWCYQVFWSSLFVVINENKCRNIPTDTHKKKNFMWSLSKN